MAAPDLRIRRTGGQSLTAGHFSHVRVDSRVSHVLGQAGKAGVKAGRESLKTGGETLAGHAAAAKGEEPLAESQGRATLGSLANTGRRGTNAAISAVGGKVGATAGAKAEAVTLTRLGQPTRAQVSSLTSRVVGTCSKRQARKVVYRQLAPGKTTPARMARRTANWVARRVSALVGKVVAALMAKVSVVLLTVFFVCTLVILVLSIISSFMPAWLAGDEADHPAEVGAGIVGVVADGLGNDYPYADRPYNTVNTATGYYFGNCTDFVIWRVNRDAGVTSAPWRFTNANTTPGGGNGYQWGAASALPGWTVVDRPSPGDIVSFQPGSQNGRWNAAYGHVAYVGQVSDDGSMIVENYGTGEYFQTTYTAHQMSQLVSSGQAIIKHNPSSTLKIKTANGVSTVDALGTVGGGAGGPLSATAAQATARSMLKDYGWGDDQFQCLVNLWNGESGWNYKAENPSSGAYGIPQALPASKMASAGADWQTNATTQIRWGLDYIKSRPDYGSPCAAWNKWQSRSPHWY